MTAYSVTGTTSPDCTTASTGEPAGTYGGEPYWSWVNGATTWYLWFDLGIGGWWWISATPPGDSFEDAWGQILGTVTGLYAPYTGLFYSGDSTIAEYIPPAASTYATLTIADGPLAGQYIVLKTG